MENNELEDKFKESFKNFEADVSDSVWKNIQTALKGFGIGALVKMLFNKIGTSALVAIVSSIATIAGTVAVMNWANKTETKTVVKDATEHKTITKPNPIVVNEIKKFLSPVKEENATPVAEQKQVVENGAVSKQKNLDVKGKATAKDKQELKSVINELSSEPVAIIAASPVSGAVPLIVNLSNTGIGKINKWTFSDGKNANTTPNPIHVFETPGTYTVILSSTNADGKKYTDSVKIEVTGNSSLASTPPGFSPTRDKIFSFQSKNMVKMNVVVFDKNSKIVCSSEGLDFKWDGNDLDGKISKVGTYYYILKAQGVDGKKYEQKGAINLTR
jgi:PKD repeat protein